MVFDHLIHRARGEKLRPSTLNQAVVALRMFYRDYLGRAGSCGSNSRSVAISRCRWCSHAMKSINYGSVRENRFKRGARAHLSLRPACW